MCWMVDVACSLMGWARRFVGCGFYMACMSVGVACRLMDWTCLVGFTVL